MIKGEHVIIYPSIGGRIIRVLTVIFFIPLLLFPGSSVISATYKIYTLNNDVYQLFNHAYVFGYLYMIMVLAIIFDSVRVQYSRIELTTDGIYYSAPLKRRFLPFRDIINVRYAVFQRGPNFYDVITKSSKIKIDILLFSIEKVSIIERRLFEEYPILRTMKRPYLN